MATTWKFYADAGLTVPLTTGDFTNPSTGGPHDRIIYLGSATAGKKLQAGSGPGVDAIQIGVTDSAPGAGPAASAVTLALSAGGLGTNTPGEPLAVGTTLYSGAGGAVAVFVRVNSGLSTPGSYTDLGLETSLLVETMA